MQTVRGYCNNMHQRFLELQCTAPGLNHLGEKQTSDSICLFPDIGDTEATETSLETVRFDPCVVHRLNCCSHGVHRVLPATWAIVLSRFIQADVVRFGIDTNASAMNESGKTETYVYTVVINPQTPIKSLLEAQSLDISAVQQDDPDIFNTGVWIEHSSCGQSKLYDVNLVVKLGGSQPTMELVYHRRCLSQFHAQCLTNVVTQATHCILEDPNQPISQASLCCALQKKRIISWQSYPLRNAAHQAVFQAIKEHVLRQPTALAVEDSNGALTYAELDKLSSHLAVHLQDRYGVGSGTMVMLCVSKTRWAIVAMLAINKAGACFVPCNSDTPASRRQAMAAICNSQLVVASPEYEQTFAGVVDVTIVISPAMMESLSAEKHPRTFQSDPKAPAYCFFTSGSTGDPKGCLGSHSALAAVAHQVPALQLTPESRVLQFAKLGFGISFIEIFCTLSAGGLICVPSDHERMNTLSPVINRMRVNWALLTPTVAESLHPDSIPTLKTLFLGGESPSEGLILKWMSKTSLFQVYGTTEMAGVALVSSQIHSPQARKTIGIPSNSRVWLVDPANHDNLAPIGAVGELIIEGPSLADGYLGDPERTKKSFLADSPWLKNTSPQSIRLYKTGDLVRYNEDGSLSLVGRKGTQVKLRGQRLELEDIECRLSRLLREARVLCHAQRVVASVIEHPSHPDGRALVAVILMPNGETSGQGLRFLEINRQILPALDHVHQLLHKQLPHFMVPNLLLPLTDLPRLLTGKVDRQSLQRQLSAIPYGTLRQLAGQSHQKHQLPTTDWERAIHGLVCDALHAAADAVGMQDDFFHLGGNSIIAMKLVAAARRQSLRLAVADIFEHPILNDLVSVAGRNIKSCPVAMQPFQLLKHPHDPADVKQAVANKLNVEVSCIIDAYPCTPLQEGLIAIAERSSSSYRARVFCHLKPQIQIEAFRRAWETVVESHDILQTHIVATPSQGLLQVVVRKAIPWETAEDRQSYLARADRLPMGLGTRLVQACMLSEPNSPPIFVLTLHHALCDRWSIRVLLDTLQSIYQGGSGLRRNHFSPFVQYVDKRSCENDAYWKTRFKDLEAAIFPPLPRADLTPVSDGELRLKICIPPRIARSYTVSNYIRLSWALVVAHNTAVDDVVFGETLSGRDSQMDHQDIEHTVGPTVCTVPQRVKLDAQQSIVEALQQVQERCIQMAPYEHAGLQHIGRIGPEAEVACMFQSHLLIQPVWTPPTDIFQSVQAGPTVLGGFTSYALGLECFLSDDDNQVTIVASFDTRVLSHARVQRLLRDLDNVLRGIIQEPYQRVGDVPRMSSVDLDQIYAWNSAVPNASLETIHDLIHQQATKTPSAPAIFASDGEFTYEELDTRSNQVAWELLTSGIRPGVYIPILFHKSRWTTVAMLGVIKAGAAFVLMDPGQPLQRLSTIASEAKCTVIICSLATRRLAQQIAPTLLVGAQETHTWNHAVDLESLPTVRSQDVAYAVFTSGSTGTPKGTVIEHGSYCASMKEFSSCLRITPCSRMMQFASYTFDACIGETFGTLMAGGCVCVVSDNDRQNALARATNDARISHAMLTPTLARILRQEDVPTLKVLILMGEAMQEADSAYWSNRVELINGYGPTECSVGISYQPYHSGVHAHDIGRPRAAVAWITDPRNHNHLMPVGAVGELLLEGAPVARGYMNNPEQTAKAFLTAPPVWNRVLQRSHRIYKTGDLVRYNEDGSLRYVGRTNDQIKLRGQRLERGEVETQLRELWSWDGPAPGEVVVDAVFPLGNPDRVFLAAFLVVQHTTNEDEPLWVTPDEGFTSRAAQAEARLQQKLPNFMVPSIFVPLNHMPRMPSGKADRALLRRTIESFDWELLRQFYPAVAHSRMPSTPEELQLQEIWSRVLDRPADQIGVHDNFFRLGGDSIAGMQVVALGRGRQLDYTVGDIFRYKTIAALVEHAASPENKLAMQPNNKRVNKITPPAVLELSLLESYPGLDDLLSEANISPKDVEDVYPCAPIQRGALLVHTRTPKFYHVAFTWEVFDTSVEQVKSAIGRVIARHAIFRSCFLEPEPTTTAFIQVVMRHGQQEISVRPDIERGEFPGSFQPDARCPSQFTIYHSGQGVYVRLDITHALWDGITSLVIERDLDIACHGDLSLNPTPPLYRDYISYIHDQDAAAAAGFWSPHLAHFDRCYFPQLGAKTIPQDEPDVSQNLLFDIDHDSHSAIAQYCRKHNITPPNIYCLAWAMVLRCFTGMDNVCFGNMVSGRDVPLAGVAEIAGPLINLLPFRVNLAGGPVSTVLQNIYADYASSLGHQTCSIADLPHPTGRSPMTLFNTQVSIRRHTSDSQGGLRTRLDSIKSHDPHEQRVCLYVVMEDEQTRVQIAYWKSTMSATEASVVACCYGAAVSAILRDPDAHPATTDHLLTRQQKNLAWCIWSVQHSQMQQIWADVLNMPPDTIQPQDDFFQCGGDSIGAMKVVALARRKGMKIRLADFFLNSSLCAVGQLALGVDEF
ncbi:hypothetical protein FE257_008092 [Aspergillus nanangensis]|uniref:Carrier domain-containing protein n=1 Tax=Aspergillus nanangensis TaxID=2582783 RepID=A0AAD4CME7_ASPNN|nr:hypothetical protein FE257_008092 [Aspergillus nanangensis]